MSTDKSSGEELSEDLKILEAALRQLAPRSAQLDRDRLMYLAGQASVTNAEASRIGVGAARLLTRIRQHGWPAATAALALVSITLGGLLLHTTRSGERVVLVALPPGTDADSGLAIGSFAPANHFTVGTPSADGDTSYFQLRNLVLTHGIEALPQSPALGHPVEPQTIQPIWPVLHSHLIGDES